MSILTDTFSYITPAKVKCLVVPVNGCTEHEFERYLELVRRSHEARLLDIGADSGLQSFNPQTFPKGRVMLEYLTHMPDSELLFLEDFEPFRKVFVVLGVGPFSERATKKEETEEMSSRLRKQYAESIVHNIIFFDTPSKTVKELTPAADHSRKSVFYHEGTETHNITALETIICGVAGNLLVKIENYTSSYLSITLRSPISTTDGSTLSRSINQTQKKLGSSVSSFKQTFGSSPTLGAQQNTEAKSKTQLRQQGRQSKLMGNLYLLTGKYSDALNSFTEAISLLWKCDDYLWLGSSIEGVAVSITMLSYIGVTYNLQNPIISSILQISKSKLHSLSNSNAPISSRKTSSESTNSQNGHLSVNNPSSQRVSTTSPRNSTSSIRSFSIGNVSNSIDPSSLALPEIVKMLSSKVLYYYMLSTNNFENVIPDIAYAEYILRTIKFMILTYLSGEDFDSSALERIVTGQSLQKGYEYSENYFTKSEIVAEIDKVYSLQLVDLSIFEQCKIYSTLATMYSDLGMIRKKAFALRILLVSILPKIETSLRSEDSDVSFAAAPTLKSHHERLKSVKSVIEYLFEVYGINHQTERLASEASKHATSDWITLQLSFLKLCLRISETTKDHEFLCKICILLLTRYLHCLPPDDQLKLKQKIDDAYLLTRRSNISFVMPYWDPFIVRKVRLITNKSKEEMTPFPNYEESSNNVKVVDDTNNEFNNKGEKTNSQSGPLIFNPYNKGSKKQFNCDRILIMDELNQLKIRFQNPYAFDIDIFDISIVTDGKAKVNTLKNTIKVLSVNTSKKGFASRTGTELSVSSKSSSSNSNGNNSGQLLSTENTNYPVFTIPGNSMINLSVSFKPLNAGELNISDIELVIGNCKRQKFKIMEKEVTDYNIKIKPDFKEDCIKGDNDTLNTVIDNLSAYEENDSRALRTTLPLTVIPVQPNLSLISLSIPNNWIMLLDGEKSTFHLHLANTSSEIINYLSFSFWDNTMDAIDAKLKNNPKQYPASKIYEMEWYLFNLRPFRILNRADISERHKLITTDKNVEFDFEIVGKRGMKESKIMFEYSHKESSKDAVSFVKFLDVSLNVSILPSLEVVGCNIIPFFSSSIRSYKNIAEQMDCTQLEQLFRFVLSSADKEQEITSKYCILVIDVRSSYHDLLESTLSVQTLSGVPYETKAIIEPGKANRFFLPVSKIFANDSDLLKPIPSLRNKQFIKNYSITEEEDTRMKKVFWVRELFLEKVTGSWQTIQEISKPRSGFIDMRNIKLDSKMADMLLVPYVEIESEIFDESDGALIAPSDSRYRLETNKFYTHRVIMKNDSHKLVRGVLRHSVSLQNTASKIYTPYDRKIMINGNLQDRIDKGIEPGVRINIDTSFVVLERGDYEWGLVFDPYDSRSGKIVGRHPLLFSAT